MATEALPVSAAPAAPPPAGAPDGGAAPEGAATSKLQKFRRHFRAWWDGYYLSPEEEAARSKQGSGSGSDSEDSKAEGDDWTAKRIKVAEMTWGDGFTFPGA